MNSGGTPAKGVPDRSRETDTGVSLRTAPRPRGADGGQSRFDMTGNGHPDRRNDPPFAEGENPYVPPGYYLLSIGVLALVIAATFL